VLSVDQIVADIFTIQSRLAAGLSVPKLSVNNPEIS